jgi:4-hydroxybenzoate polyprenyltransferase
VNRSKTYLTAKRYTRNLFKLVRWPNLLMIVLTQYLVTIFLIRPQGDVSWLEIIQSKVLFLICLSTVLIAAAGYVINDYFDVKIDAINKPERVIIGRHFKRRIAMITHQTLNIIACLIGFYIGKRIFVINIISISLLWAYSSYFKKQPFIGNVIVALLTALSLLVLSAFFNQHTNLVMLYAGFAFGITLVREIIKDMEDVRGDASNGCRTLPIAWGMRPTKYFIYFLIACFIPTLFWAATQLKNVYLGGAFMLLLLPVAWLVYKLVYADTRRHFGVLSQICKVIMLIGMATMVIV